jgi:hypothetical protein
MMAHAAQVHGGGVPRNHITARLQSFGQRGIRARINPILFILGLLFAIILFKWFSSVKSQGNVSHNLLQCPHTSAFAFTILPGVKLKNLKIVLLVNHQ